MIRGTFSSVKHSLVNAQFLKSDFVFIAVLKALFKVVLALEIDKLKATIRLMTSLPFIRFSLKAGLFSMNFMSTVAIVLRYQTEAVGQMTDETRPSLKSQMFETPVASEMGV